MIFRSVLREDERRADRDEVLAAADLAFGRHPDDLAGDQIVLDGTTYVYDAASDLPFVVLPECDRCGVHDLDQFPLEEWNVGGVRVRGQARTTCRDCRFLELASSPIEPKVRSGASPQRMRRRTRRYGQTDRLAS